MASLKKRGDNYWTVRVIVDRKTKDIYLGRTPRKQAQQIKVYVEDVQACRLSGVSPSPTTAKWLSDIAGTKIHSRLVELGLADKSTQVFTHITLVDFWTDYVESLAVTESTHRLYTNAIKDFSVFFGKGKLVKDITSEDIRRLRSWLQKKGLAEATWRKKLSRLKTVLNSAVKQKLLDENPVDVPVSAYENKSRRVFIEADVIESILPYATQDLLELPTKS
ncbi:phage integrase SAM-like domain-containing protein [bacterium]|nr:phage integrase SAM-like domain-containing protein [bacterium]